ncbi:hypothetical protein L228DRAFT_284229 [Xylona heveae TC161]|uniref:Uncharacterized protein n=1 Tax=Xylona heveae (strain CBS 132557 / TC161) TaxID=1328760 RepID=A0A165FMP5_XYLHT|nr:hypothetical protein L228DRAFT_284229 [Xylona heveae TC161]KZF21163.1 hypothetical protein L228DRAFT_284229 [Xylona heveae TC161]
MLDENLPTFFLSIAPDGIKHHATFNFTQHGSEPEPAYALHHMDPALPDSHNCYTVAMLDPYMPDVPYAEVLVRPEWTHPTLSQEAIRKNGGIPPLPQPLQPTEFTIQLYGPDQQVVVKYKQSTWGGSPSWEFEMPQTTFRQPSSSSLDRSLSDPTIAPTTPRIKFTWRKEKLSKEMVCTMSGKTTDPKAKPRKSKEPDITIAMFESMKAVSIYEPNLHRVDMEDFKGLEIVILLSAAVIKDMFFGNFRQVFNITEYSPPRRASVPPHIHRKAVSGTSLPQLPTIHEPSALSDPAHGARPAISGPSQSAPPSDLRRHSSGVLSPRSASNLDPRRQWEAEVESARLRQQAETEARERRRTELAGERLAKKISKAELKEEGRRKAEIDRETERLRRVYLAEQRMSQGHHQRPLQSQPQWQGQGQAYPSLPPRQAHSAPLLHAYPCPSPSPARRPVPPQPVPHQSYGPGQSRGTGSGPSLISQNHTSGPSFGTNLLAPTNDAHGRNLGQKKRSFFGLRSSSDDRSGKKLSKKQSSLF